MLFHVLKMHCEFISLYFPADPAFPPITHLSANLCNISAMMHRDRQTAHFSSPFLSEWSISLTPGGPHPSRISWICMFTGTVWPERDHVQWRVSPREACLSFLHIDTTIPPDLHEVNNYADLLGTACQVEWIDSCCEKEVKQVVERIAAITRNRFM